MNLQTYRSLLTGKRTMLVLDNGKSYGKGRLEAHIRCLNGKFYYAITNGYDYLTHNLGGNKNLKSTLNNIEYKLSAIYSKGKF